MPSINFEKKGGVLPSFNFSPYEVRSNSWVVLKQNKKGQPTEVLFGEEPRYEPLGEIFWVFSPFAWVTRLVHCERHVFNYLGMFFTLESDHVRCRIYDKHIFTENEVINIDYVTRISVNLMRPLHIRGNDGTYDANQQTLINFQIFYQTKTGIASYETREIKYYKHDAVGDTTYIQFTEVINSMVEMVIQNYAKIFKVKKKKSFFGQLLDPRTLEPIANPDETSTHTTGNTSTTMGNSVAAANVSVHSVSNHSNHSNRSAGSGGVTPAVFQRMNSTRSMKGSKVVPMEIQGRQNSKLVTNRASTYQVAVPDGYGEGQIFQFVDNFGEPINVVIPKGSIRGSILAVTV